MSLKFRVLSFIVTLIVCCCIAVWTFAADNLSQVPQEQKIQIHHDLEKDVITARLERFRIAADTDRYHSLDLSVTCTFSDKPTPIQPKVDLELFTVVKARKLNTDLYVVFVVDDKEVHFGSNRSAILNPVPGRLWVGERMVFSVPVEEFQKFAAAEKLAIKMGGIRFDLNEDARTGLKVFADKIKQIAR